MKILFTFYFITINFVLVQSSHFSGGTITWKPLNTTGVINSTISVMFTQSYQWKRSSSNSFCNDTYILNRSPLVPTTSNSLICVTTTCGGYRNISTRGYCIDYSIQMDSTSTQISTIMNLTVGSKFCIAFQETSWVKLNVRCSVATGNISSTITPPVCYNSNADWSIGTCVDLSIRLDGVINSPPVATIMSPIKVPINTTTYIKIPLIDANGDYLRCRWAVNTAGFDECADACGHVNGATLNETTCIIEFKSVGKKVGDYFAVTLTVEDFYSTSDTTALSSVPIQFLINIVSTPLCPNKSIIESTLSSCTVIQAGVSFNFTLTIKQGCSGTTIVDYFRMPPLGMSVSEIQRIGSSNVWTVTEMWIPTNDQIGSQVYCAIAMDNAAITSDQYCTTFTVIPFGETIVCPIYSSTTPSPSSTISSTETPERNNLIPALGLGLSIPLILLLTTLCICRFCCDKCQFLNLKSFRRRFKRARSIHHRENSIDFNHQYINTRKPRDKEFNSTLSSEIRPFAVDDRVASSTISDFELNYLNQTKTSLFSVSNYQLPTENLQYTNNLLSPSILPLDHSSILMRAYSRQQYQTNFSTSQFI